MGTLALCQATAETKTQAEPLVELAVCRFFLLAKVVDLDPCLSKKPLEEKPSLPYSARESLSEVQSLSSFQSESCDDNGKAAELGAAGLAFFFPAPRRGVVSIADTPSALVSSQCVRVSLWATVHAPYIPA